MKRFIKAASAARMLGAFEDKLAEMQSNEVESATQVNSSVTLTDEQRDLLWEVIDQYNTSHPVSGRWEDETAHEQQTIADTFGISLADAKQIMIDELGFDPELRGHMEGDHWAEDLNSCSNVNAAEQLQLFDDDGYHNYEDTDGMYTGVPGSFVTLAELKNYWNDFYDDDPVLNEEYDRDQGGKWLRDTLSHMIEVESDDVEGATDASSEEIDPQLDPIKGGEGAYDVFTLIEYYPGDAETGIDGDEFNVLGTFFATDLADAKRQLERVKRANPRYKLLENPYVDEYSPERDGYHEVYQDLDTLINSAYLDPSDIDGNMPEEPVFDSTEVDDLEACGDVPVEGGLDNYYFGKEQAEKYGDLICDALSGQTVSKRKDTAEQPGGLIYEANQLGLDMWDLLEALEGLCYQGRAMEIDDSTYKIK